MKMMMIRPRFKLVVSGQAALLERGISSRPSPMLGLRAGKCSRDGESLRPQEGGQTEILLSLLPPQKTKLFSGEAGDVSTFLLGPSLQVVKLPVVGSPHVMKEDRSSSSPLV
uniref:Uncharacterized protein n=1 Tax=Micrurus lemniscatus lemniscatus TaxID=129467 RepID=A0A2D4IA86_MICLE